MATDTSAGETKAITPQPSAGPSRSSSITAAAYPVALPANASARIKTAPEPAANPEEELLTPSSIKGWAWSLVSHSLLLLVLAFWILTPHLHKSVQIDSLMAGSPFGNEFGDQLTGGQGMDTPLAMPEGAGPTLEETEPTFVSTPAAELNLKPDVPSRAANATAANGGGMNLRNPGQAGSGDGFGVAKFGHGGKETINGIDVKVGNPQFTLIWDTRVDIDLHVLEPGGSHIYWEMRNGERGGELDVDDVDGFGPENIYWGGGLDKGNGPPGKYTWYVHYYSGQAGAAPPTRWKVRIKLNGKYIVREGKLRAPGDKSKQESFTVGPEAVADSASARNGEATTTGAAAGEAAGWRVISPPEGGLRVSFPFEPKIETILGTRRMFLERDGGQFIVLAKDVPDSAKEGADGAGAFMDLELNKMIKDEGGKLQGGKKISLQRHAGRESAFSLPESKFPGGGVGKARAYVVGSKLYVVSLLGTPEFVSSGDAETFLKSVQFDDK